MFATKRIKIDTHLYARAREAAPQAGYATTRELVEHAIEKLLAELGRQSGEDKRTVEERLRGLGYIS